MHITNKENFAIYMQLHKIFWCGNICTEISANTNICQHKYLGNVTKAVTGCYPWFSFLGPETGTMVQPEQDASL